MARKILLADDSVTAQNMGRRILTDAGYEVTTVNNGSAALKKILEAKPDLIVLDVYMPGYGGLEVCQRIRESEETARIPVLLTVGKLEPFKAEDARRVRADAFVVKPFEASELLTALSKLEDKIVPPPQPHKPGRSAVPTAAIERMSAGNSFGDAETGWKNRLTIPPPHQKARHDDDSEPYVEPAHPAPVPSLQEKVPERIATGMGDITPDEIAAITAAAAAFSSQGEDPFAKLIQAVEAKSIPQPEAKAEPVAEPPSADMGATFASAPEVSTEAEKEPAATEPVPVIEATPAPELVPVQDEAPKEAVAEVPPAELPVTPEAASFTPTPTEEVAESGKLAHEEVAAALASLAPIPGVPGGEGLPGIAASAAGPRWVAEAVALADEEAALILEEEMIKAQAALAAVAAEAAAAPVTQFEIAPAQNPTEAEAYATALPSAEVSQPEESREVPAASAVTDAVAEQVQSEIQAAEVKEKEEAFAASAGATADSASSVDAISNTATPVPEADFARPPVDLRRESELAAAWANWKQVRDSVANPEFTAQIAEVAAAGLAESEPPEPAPVQESAAPSEANPPEETGAIASIVDSVLAELKPRLMEEIAKKIKKDK